MKQTITFLQFPLIIGILFLSFTAMQTITSEDVWTELTEKESVTVSYKINDKYTSTPQIEINFENANPYSVNVTWKNQVKFQHDSENAIQDNNTNSIQLEANSTDNRHIVELAEISTIRASMPVEDFQVLNLTIIKN